MTRFISIASLALLLTLNGCQLGDYLSGDMPAVAARKMEDPDFADERREGINTLISDHSGLFIKDRWTFAKKPPYTTRYRQLAEDDQDYIVRMTAVRALNRARDRESTPVFIRCLSDRNEWVRLEAAKALSNVPDPSAVPALLKVVQNPDENRNVRMSACDALRHYKTIEVARTLVAVLNEREFGVAWQARNSLKDLTGHDKYYDQVAWLEYLTGSQKPFG